MLFLSQFCIGNLFFIWSKDTIALLKSWKITFLKLKKKSCYKQNLEQSQFLNKENVFCMDRVLFTCITLPLPLSLSLSLSLPPKKKAPSVG